MTRKKVISKTKKDNMLQIKESMTNKIINIFKEHPFIAYNYKQVSKLTDIKKSASKKELVKDILENLYRKNILTKIKTGKYKLNPAHIKPYKKSCITGIVDMKKTGKAYIITEDLREDVFISANNTNCALDGDKVKVYLFPKRSGRKAEGQIIEIILRAKTKFVGIIKISKNLAFLIPDNISMPVNINIPLNNLKGAKNGQKVLAKITEWPKNSKNPFGKIIDILGYPEENDVEMLSILAEYDFPLSFSKNIEDKANKISSTISKAEILKRKDFRNITTFTIDPAEAKDFDDAISIRELKNNIWEIGIHIADVSYYIDENCLLDNEAYKRGTSVYLVDRVIPMLPEILSNNVCSLMPDKEKLCFSVVFEIKNFPDRTEIINEWFGKTIIKSNKRFTYEQVQKIIETEKETLSKEILTLNDLAHKLRKERFKKGALYFKSTEVEFKLDKKGKPIGIYIKEQKDSHKLIEEFMLLANKKVAELIGKKKINNFDKSEQKTFVYRIHNTPTPEKLEIFTKFVNKLGYNMNTDSKKNIASSFNKILKETTGKGEENMIEKLVIRTMQKAYYSTENAGHYGLAFSYYTHFTSPIRRYPDLIVHRLLYKYLQGEKSVNKKIYKKKCERCSEMETKADQAERSSIKYKQIEFLQDKTGQQFDGLISGVSKWGIYVEIVSNKCEGMIPIAELNDDFYYIDENNYCLIGQKKGNKYKLGDKIKITVKQADLRKRQLTFALA